MSEYQYYEFRTINRQLSADERKAVDSMSSRGHTTATSFSVEYSYSDFRHDETQVLADYFDIFFYIANWGSVTLKMRFPSALVDTSMWAPYCIETPESMLVDHTTVGDSVLLTFSSYDDHGFDWIDSVDALDGLSGLYNDILQGDLRALYLGWLRAIQFGSADADDFYDDFYGYDNNTVEPPVPPGLDALSPALKEFVDQLGVDSDLVAAAAIGSESQTPAQQVDMVAALNELTNKECANFLYRFLQGEPHLELELKKRIGLLQPQAGAASQGKRTVGQLLAAVEEVEAQRKKEAASAAEAKHKAEMQALAARGDEAWQEVDELIKTSKSKAYDQAVALLEKLHALALEQDQVAIFESRVEHIRKQYGRRSSLMRLMKDAQLV